MESYPSRLHRLDAPRSRRENVSSTTRGKRLRAAARFCGGMEDGCDGRGPACGFTRLRSTAWVLLVMSSDRLDFAGKKGGA